MSIKQYVLSLRAQMLIVLTAHLFLTGCIDIKNKKTTIAIVDNDRHYYPIVQGQKLEMMFPIKNTGKYPLIVTDIFTSCGCLVLEKKSSVNTIPPGKEGRLLVTYNSNKNIGYVKHYVTLYGNFLGTDKQEVSFDVHVVPSALYTKDYEELYEEEKEKDGGLKNMVDGDENNKGYYLDKDL